MDNKIIDDQELFAAFADLKTEREVELYFQGVFLTISGMINVLERNNWESIAVASLKFFFLEMQEEKKRLEQSRRMQ